MLVGMKHMFAVAAVVAALPFSAARGQQASPSHGRPAHRGAAAAHAVPHAVPRAVPIDTASAEPSDSVLDDSSATDSLGDEPITADASAQYDELVPSDSPGAAPLGQCTGEACTPPASDLWVAGAALGAADTPDADVVTVFLQNRGSIASPIATVVIAVRQPGDHGSTVAARTSRAEVRMVQPGERVAVRIPLPVHSAGAPFCLAVTVYMPGDPAPGLPSFAPTRGSSLAAASP